MLRMIFAAVVVATGVAVPACLSAQTACLPTDTITTLLEADFKLQVAATDSVSVQNRTIFSIPAVSASDVSIVSDSATCAAAAATLASVTPGGDPQPAAWVIRLGPTRYAAYNGMQKREGSAVMYILDASFAILKSFAM